ncbi:hypothetical protein [Streptomyces sp. WM6378]|uniref:hypothetical protein n=1 Tax=Streptomyces sp. WM6378 TaxID=1415557 RepID=UPI000ABA059E|nr:hypothetical protein [Streptomyces sp. WM6378]
MPGTPTLPPAVITLVRLAGAFPALCAAARFTSGCRLLAGLCGAGPGRSAAETRAST